MQIRDVMIGLAALAGEDLHLVFADKNRIWVPCTASHQHPWGMLKQIGASGWTYDVGISAFVLSNDRQ